MAKRRKSKSVAKKLSRTQKPPHMSLEEWQTGLRRQFGREQRFALKNLTQEEIFSDFHVRNPESGNTYRVSIRGGLLGENFCTCPDFATNTLGTCKHIEFTLAKLEKRRGARAAILAGYQPEHSEIRLQYGDERRARFFKGTQCPDSLSRLAAKYFDSSGVLKIDAFKRFETFLSEAAKLNHELRCYEDVLSFVAEVRDRDRRRQVIEQAYPKGIKSPALDQLLKVSLYDYQKQGALFAASAGRCLIGDEMGLGKTIQAIAAARLMKKHLGVERALIVCPTSLKHQWQREIEKFSGESTCVIAGLRTRRERQFREDSFFKITNYDTVHSDLDLIANWHPDLVILDEAQRIKNWKTRTAQSVKRIASPYAIVLTGTPLENRLEELASIVSFVDRHRLGPNFRFLADHQVTDDDGKVIGYKDLDQIGKTLEPILIRRRKAEVLKQLPGRMDKNFFVPMTPEQMRHHDENKENVARIVLKWRRQKFLSEADQRRLMIALQNMRMSCDSTYLLDQESDFGAKADEVATLLDELFETRGLKVVIFSQWLRMHELVVRRFAKKKWDHVMFHGQLSSNQRKEHVDRFREQENCRAFLATDAGGVGLNLQHANAVVNCDLPWNPAVLEQRIGRVHRLGQTQPVQVVNFVAQGTIEEGMLNVLKFKKSLFAGVLDGGEKEVFLGGSRLSKFMETVEKATGAIPVAQVEEQVPAAPVNGEEERAKPPEAETPPATDGQDAWAGLLATGLDFLGKILNSAQTPQGVGATGGAAKGVSIVRRDEATGESYLRLPMPGPETMERLLGAVSTLMERFSGRK
jgi:superfamily II DNA or RNA helicase